MQVSLFYLALFLLFGCQGFNEKESVADKAQRMLDDREYLSVIEYLEGRDLNAENTGILIDAFIGASGFEILNFLEQVEISLRANIKNEHPVQYLDDLLSPLGGLNQTKKNFINKAVKLATKQNNMENFKIGVVNLFQAVHIVKSGASHFRPKLTYDSNHNRVIIMTDEDKLELAKRVDHFIGAIFRSYAHLRRSYNQIASYFTFIDEAIEELLGVQIEKIEDFKDLNIEKAITLFLKNNPEALKRIAVLVTNECDNKLALEYLRSLRVDLSSRTEAQNLLTILNILITEVELLEDRTCDNEISYYSHRY